MVTKFAGGTAAIVQVNRTAPNRPQPPPGTRRAGPLKIVAYTVVWVFTGFNIFILYWLVTSGFKTPNEIFNRPFGLPKTLFSRGTPLRNFAQAWNDSGFGHAFLVTVILVAVASVTIVVIAAPAAYALSRLGVRGSGALTTFFAVGIGVPFQTLIIPLFVSMAKIHLTDSLLGLYIVYVALSLPFTVFLLTGFFRSLPDDLEEAAAIDGASPFGIFSKIMLPLARGGLITALILNAIGLWNETLLSLVFLHSNSTFTLARTLFVFNTQMTYTADYGALLAGVAIVVLPMLVLYILLARRIIEGLTLGSGK